ncbi:RIP metalloprotease RseP [Rhodoligotrophos ferricapiens]|uniref:RIP metalloprotease RseP n=1 Tax=Rhodoligotrophos ferricapiens TaxID=3069264 RepID=UPI00315CB2B4
MLFAETIGSGVWSFLSYLVPFLFVLTIVVFFHELGHFLTARACRVKVDSFAVGFGRSIASWIDRHGTEWRIGWLPLGGYVSFRGDSSVASTPDRSVMDAAAADPAEAAQLFHNKPLAQRAAVVAAGPIANFIIAILIFAATFMLVGRQVAPPIADTVQPDSPAAAAGMQPGDEIKTVDGRAIETFSDLQRIVSGSAGRQLNLGILRNASTITLQVTPAAREIEDRFGGRHTVGLLGITASTEGARVERYGPVMALWKGAEQTWFVISSTLAYVGQVIIGTQSADQLGGPLRIAQMSGEVAGISFLALLNLAAVLSVSIGLVNLFPIPILDGGHLLYYAIEAVRGRPLSPKAQDLGFRVGMVLVLMLMLFATWNDLIHFELF